MLVNGAPGNLVMLSYVCIYQLAWYVGWWVQAEESSALITPSHVSPAIMWCWFQVQVRAHINSCKYMYHYNDVIMTTMASKITSLTVVYSTIYSDADQRKHQSSALLAFVWGIHRDRWNPRTKGQLRGKCFHLMTSSWSDIFLTVLADAPKQAVLGH